MKDLLNNVAVPAWSLLALPGKYVFHMTMKKKMESNIFAELRQISLLK